MGSLQGRASIYDLQKKPVLNGRFFVLSHSIILSIIFPTTIHFLFNPHKKTEALTPVSPVCCIQFSMLLHFIPLKISSAISNPICPCCSGVRAWPVSSNVVRRASFRCFIAFWEAVSGTILSSLP